MMRAFMFPGQGSQKVGMDAGLPRRRFEGAGAALGYALSTSISQCPPAERSRTANTQPALLAVSVAWLDELTARGIEPQIAAGHSLGEYAALVCAGALDFTDAIRLVHLRGKLMQEAVPEGLGAMAAIIGLEAKAVADLCVSASPDSGDACQPANFNGAGQVVIAGHKGAVTRAMQLAKDQGAKLVTALPVSAPFHSVLMAPAARGLELALADVKIAPMKIPVVANVTGEAYQDAALTKDLLVRQVTGSVRWEESVQLLVKLGVTEVYEVGAGNALRGMMKRIAPTIAIRDLPKQS